MPDSILVAYASKSGGTVEIAEAIGFALGRDGALVDVTPVQMVENVMGYRGIVLGSAIRNGHWLPEAMDFANRFHAELNVIPTAIFSVHLFNLDDSVESTANRWSYTAPVFKLFRPVAEAFFAGRMSKEQLSIFEKSVISVMETPDQNRIDWKAVRAWAAKIAPVIGAKKVYVPDL